MAEDCWLSCPELFEHQDKRYGLLGPFGDTAVDSPELSLDEARQMDPQLVADYEAYAHERSAVAKNCDENYETCAGPAIAYDIKTRQPFFVCPITPKPYHMPIELF